MGRRTAPCNELGFDNRSAKEPETPPAERALRIAPVSKEPPAAREPGPRDQCKSPEGRAWNWVTVLICLCPHLPKSRNITGPDGTRGVQELYVDYTWPRNRPRALQGGRQCRRHRSNEREECAAREPERAWILLEIVGGSRSGEREPLRFLSDF